MNNRKSSFSVSLLFYVTAPEVRRAIETELSVLTATHHEASLSRDHYEFIPYFVSEETTLAHKVIELLYMTSSPLPLVLVSDSILEGTEERLQFSATGQLIDNACLTNSIPAAFIALGSDSRELPKGLVAQVGTSPLDLLKLREAIGRAALRVHLMAPPRSGTGRVSRDPSSLDSSRFSFQLAETPEQLLSCFELRYSIYDVMGYLSKEIASSGLGLEVDFHDGISLHFLALDTATQEVAATLRLVLPNQPWGVCASVGPEFREAFLVQQRWFRRLAEFIKSPALQRKLLDAGAGALPMLQNARVSQKWQKPISDGLNGVEISRCVVPPKFRGLGLSRTLLHQALAAAFELGRRTVFAECVPSHVPMYQQYGFADIEGRGVTTEEWGSFPHTPQALLLDLSQGNSRHVQTARWDNALFKMANAEIVRPPEIKVPASGEAISLRKGVAI